MTFTRLELHAFTRKLYRFLQGDHVLVLKKMRTKRGWIEHDLESNEATVLLDHRDRLISTLIHEFIHWWYPRMSESKVLEMERAVINQLSDRQVRNIIKRFAQAL